MGTSFDAAAAERAAQAARRGRPGLLEQSQNVVTAGRENRCYEIARCGCECWYCSDCCQRKGYTLRARLIPALETFTGLMMLTLTVDPQLFSSPRDAYLYVRGHRALSRLMQDLNRADCLHSRRYFYVVEFQKQTEQAHFHVLIDATFVSKSIIDAAWSKFRPPSAGPVLPNRPAFGMTRFSVRRFSGGACHAARYATKYLVKVPDHGFPAWVMQMGQGARVPRYGTSRRFWGGQPKERPAPTRGKRQRLPRSYAARAAECGSSSNVFEFVDAIEQGAGGTHTQKRWLGRVRVEIGRLSGKVGVQVAPRRIMLVAPGHAACVAALAAGAGHPVSVLARRGGR